jgi:hypothetical protein
VRVGVWGSSEQYTGAANKRDRSRSKHRASDAGREKRRKSSEAGVPIISTTRREMERGDGESSGKHTLSRQKPRWDRFGINTSVRLHLEGGLK